MGVISTLSEKKLLVENPAGWKIARLKCSRCEGLMVIEQHDDFPAQRCVQCGEVIDAVILQNRQRRLSVGMS